MTNAIAGLEFRRLLDQQPCSKDLFEICYVFPAWLGEGYKRDIELRNQITLTLHDYQLQENLLINCSEEQSDCLEFVFNLNSTRQIEPTYTLRSGQHYLMGQHTQGGTFLEVAEDPIQAVDIHICPSLIESLLIGNGGENGIELGQLLEEHDEFQIIPPQPITPQMKVALEQIFGCPFQGMTKQLYLEAKALELVALQIEMIARTQGRDQSNHPSSNHSKLLKGDDLDRIYQAKNILIEQADNPPSLIALAHQVGLNDCTFKRQFRQVFGTTVFGYLHHYRLEQARLLLLKQELSITAIAHQVGYKDISAFGRAFRKKFGVSPRSFYTCQSFS